MRCPIVAVQQNTDNAERVVNKWMWRAVHVHDSCKIGNVLSQDLGMSTTQWLPCEVAPNWWGWVSGEQNWAWIALGTGALTHSLDEDWEDAWWGNLKCSRDSSGLRLFAIVIVSTKYLWNWSSCADEDISATVVGGVKSRRRWPCDSGYKNMWYVGMRVMCMIQMITCLVVAAINTKKEAWARLQCRKWLWGEVKIPECEQYSMWNVWKYGGRHKMLHVQVQVKKWGGDALTMFWHTAQIVRWKRSAEINVVTIDSTRSQFWR